MGVYSEATTWSLDNFGEILVACSYDDGKLYEWLPTDGSDIVTMARLSDSDWTKVLTGRLLVAQARIQRAVNAIEQDVTTDTDSVYQLDISLVDDTTDPRQG